MSNRFVQVTMLRDSGMEERQVVATISADSVRAFYPRRGGVNAGTRLTFSDGGGFVVAETYDDLKARPQFVGAGFVELTQLRHDAEGTEDRITSAINPAHLRAYYPRQQRDGEGELEVGTRLTFDDGGGFPVAETYEQVQAAVAPSVN